MEKKLFFSNSASRSSFLLKCLYNIKSAQFKFSSDDIAFELNVFFVFPIEFSLIIFCQNISAIYFVKIAIFFDKKIKFTLKVMTSSTFQQNFIIIIAKDVSKGFVMYIELIIIFIFFLAKVKSWKNPRKSYEIRGNSGISLNFRGFVGLCRIYVNFLRFPGIFRTSKDFPFKRKLPLISVWLP